MSSRSPCSRSRTTTPAVRTLGERAISQHNPGRGPSEHDRPAAERSHELHLERRQAFTVVGVLSRATRGDVVGRQPQPATRCPVDDHHVPVILGIDCAIEHLGAGSVYVNFLDSDDDTSRVERPTAITFTGDWSR